MKRFLSSLGTLLIALSWIGGLVLLLIGGARIFIALEPWLNLAAWIVILIGTPISLILLIPRKTRGYGGAGLYIVSLPIGLWIWVASLIYALSVSFFWTVAGVILGGVGVVPVALIMMMIRGEWSNFSLILGVITIQLFIRFIGLGFVVRAEERDLIDQLQTQPMPSN